MSISEKNKINKLDVLTNAYLKAGKEMGLTQKELGKIIGKGQSSISRSSVDPDSKTGEIAKIFIRIYRAIFVLVGGDNKQIKHWMRTLNSHTRGIPAEQIQSISGLMTVVGYLDAIRGKV
jgi:predicted transcriptional regulator